MNKKFLLLALFLTTILGFGLGSCVPEAASPVYVKNGKEYGKVKSGIFRHRWWNYFERGLSYAEGEYYRNAISDIKDAIAQRDRDQRRARTYGMHFIDYFPHRELGIVYYQLGDFKTARGELELSLNQFPSAKAQFYLDKVRKKLIEEKFKTVAPPKLNLVFKSQKIWTRADPVVLSGTAEDEHFVKAIHINDSPIYIASSQKQVIFKKEMSLAQGQHIINVKAQNLVGGVTSKQVTINVDRQGPMITLDRIDDKNISSGQQVTISGSIYDEAGVAGLKINDRPLLIQPDVEISFTYQLPFGTQELAFITEDKLGNITTVSIPFNSIITANSDRVMYAGLASNMQMPLLASIFGPKDETTPEITLKGWTATQTVYLEKIYVEGRVKDQNDIVSLMINQKPMLRRKGRIILFSHFMALKEGDNKITVRAEDEKGNVAEETISVIRQIPKSLQLSERLSMSVLPFEKEGSLVEVSDTFQVFLIDALVNQNRFRIIERNKLDVILQEQKLSRTKLIDEKTAIKVGRLMAVQSIVAGSIIQTRLGTEIIARVVDTETSEILAASDVYDEVSDVNALGSLSDGLAIKFHREFPLVDGLVMQKKGSNIFTDMGQGKIKVNRRIIVFREEPVKHPVTGKVLGSDNLILGRARVTQVMPELSKAEVVDGQAGKIEPLDKVISE